MYRTVARAKVHSVINVKMSKRLLSWFGCHVDATTRVQRVKLNLSVLSSSSFSFHRPYFHMQNIDGIKIFIVLVSQTKSS